MADAGGVIGVWVELAGLPKEFVENIKAMVDATMSASVPTATCSPSRVGEGTYEAWPGMTGGFF